MAMDLVFVLQLISLNRHLLAHSPLTALPSQHKLLPYRPGLKFSPSTSQSPGTPAPPGGTGSSAGLKIFTRALLQMVQAKFKAWEHLLSGTQGYVELLLQPLGPP